MGPRKQFLNRKCLSVVRIKFLKDFCSASISNLFFSAMWSPSFVPKPDDWPEQCRVVGTFTKPGIVSINTDNYSDFYAWLEKGSTPVFIGFGSMVIDEPETLSNIIMKAAIKANCRIVVQSGWSTLDVSGEQRCFNIGTVHLLSETC